MHSIDGLDDVFTKDPFLGIDTCYKYGMKQN